MGIAKKLSLIIVVLLFLLSCSAQESLQFKDQPSSFHVPNSKQLALSKNIIPTALLDVSPRAVDSEEALRLLKSRAVGRRLTKVVANNEDELGIDEYDPFATLRENNQTESFCGPGHIQQPPIQASGSGNAFCLTALAKLALHRGVSHFSNFSSLLPDLAEELFTNEINKGEEFNHVNESIDTHGANGFEVKVFYDNCSQQMSLQTDSAAYDMCMNAESALAKVYYRVIVYPLVSKFPEELSVIDAIGKMEWLVDADNAIEGEMIISRYMMSQVEEEYTPKQMQFEFRSDKEGEFRDFVIKFERELTVEPFDWAEIDYSHEWNANIIHVTRIPATEEDPAVWSVRGSAYFNVGIWNPLEPWWLNVQGNQLGTVTETVEPRILFAAVADDVFTEGRAVFNAILADGPGLNLDDYPEASWSHEFHHWASFKKMLESTHTEEFYQLDARWNSMSAIRLHDSESARFVPHLGLRGHEDTIENLDTSHDGMLLASASSDGSVKIWDVAQESENYGQLINDFPNLHGGSALHEVAFHPSDKDVIASSDASGHVRITQISSGANLASFTPGIVDAIGFKLRVNWSADGNYIVTASDTGAKVWSAVSGSLVTTLDDGETLHVASALFYPDSNSLILTAVETGKVHRWHLASPESPEHTYETTNGAPILDLAFSPEQDIASPHYQSFAATTLNGPIFIWNREAPYTLVDSFQPKIVYETRYGSRLLYSGDGGTLYMKSGFDLLVHTLGQQAATRRIYIGPGNDDQPYGLASFALMPGQPTKILIGHPYAANVVEPGVDIELYDLQSGFMSPVFQGHGGSEINQIRFSTDDSLLLTASEDHTARLWNAQTGEIYNVLAGHSDGVLTAEFNPDSTQVVTASLDGTARIWSVSSGEQLITPISHASGAIRSATFSPDGQLIITAGDDDFVRGWDAETGEASGVITSIRNEHYTWEQSASNASVFYLAKISPVVIQNSENYALGGVELSSGNPFFSQPDFLYIDATPAPVSPPESLNAGEWGFGDIDSLGFNTVYLNLSGEDPDLLASDAISVKHDIAINLGANAHRAYFDSVNMSKLILRISNAAFLYSATNIETPICFLGVVKPGSDLGFSESGNRAIILGPEENTPSLFFGDGENVKLININSAQIGEFCYGYDTLDVVNELENTAFIINKMSASEGSVMVSGNHMSTEDYLLTSTDEVVLRYDIDPLSPTYLMPQSPFLYQDSRDVYAARSSGRSFDSMAFSSSGSTVAIADEYVEFDPAWLNFDSLFEEPSWLYSPPYPPPDGNDTVNPYYVEHELVTDGGEDNCYLYEVDFNDLEESQCLIACSEVGGCMTYRVESQYEHDMVGTDPAELETKFGHLTRRLSQLSPLWLTERFMEKQIE